MKTAVAYTRVSTASQGRSGLGLEAQTAALARFAEAEGYDLAETFTEIETESARQRRPAPQKQILEARPTKRRDLNHSREAKRAAQSGDLASALAFALRFRGSKRPQR